MSARGHVCQDCKPMHSGPAVWLCPKHAATADLLAVLKLMVSVGDAYINVARIEGQSVDNAAAVVHRARAAIAAAGG